MNNAITVIMNNLPSYFRGPSGIYAGAGDSRMAADRMPIGVVGNDAIGTQILSEMSAAGIDMQFVRTRR